MALRGLADVPIRRRVTKAQRAKAAGFLIDQGYGPLRGVAFRIGHMGDHSLERLEALLRTL